MRDLSLRIEAAIATGAATVAQVSEAINHPKPSVSCALWRMSGEGRVKLGGFVKARGKAGVWTLSDKQREAAQ